MTFEEARDKHPELEELRGLIEDEIKVINSSSSVVNILYADYTIADMLKNGYESVIELINTMETIQEEQEGNV